MILRSTKFNDVYFSVDDGLAETHHVFINGNNVVDGWSKRKKFVVAETGFGTGLNFLATWKLFEESAPEGHRLHFISFEKYPLSKGEIAEALSVWRAELGDYIDRYLAVYPIRVPGPHMIHLTPYVTLTVWFGDIGDVLPQWQGFHVDAWYLDGFTPAKNPEMWTQNLYNHMARLSYNGTSFASFTAAGHVRRGLAEAGFAVAKAKGFGRKRDMICGHYEGDREDIKPSDVKSIAIVGGGIAGCAVAYLALQRGMKPVIYEAADHLAAGASGGKLGMLNPKLTAKPSAQSDYYTAAFANALRVLRQFKNVDFMQRGSLHLCMDEDKDRRFTGYVENLGWHEDHIKRDGRDLFYPDGANVSPSKLCEELARDVDVRLNCKVTSLDDLDEDFIVLANGYAVNDLSGREMPVQSVRGQVSWVKPQDDVNGNICFSGYITPENADGYHVLGSSFQPWDKDIDVREQDHLDNIDRYTKATGKSLHRDDVIGGWAALRTASKDRFPIIGHLDGNVYLSVAHGSHGIISGFMAADIILAQMEGQPVPASGNVLKALSPKRFAA